MIKGFYHFVGSHMQTDKTTNNSTFDEPVNINEDSLCTVPPLLLTFKEPQKEDTNIIKWVKLTTN